MNKILFFAGLQEKAGKESVEVEVSGQTVYQVKELLEKEYGLTDIHEAMTAVNEELAANDVIIKEKDTVAFLPPVSGG
ncbi:molybdopterin converting factor subunit 1 [Halobacillus sp. Marseille-Q1614]|uniref:molybdopterin converting factor subunit 1 n=1 Tax=Halobacillus sp. Marseille-Q1614 TaxID=2709134 RepID=UPI00156EF632|nr:molybdopterin converting factor subunit 1 [Halobacillus sp. Marseille-Q1614]